MMSYSYTLTASFLLLRIVLMASATLCMTSCSSLPMAAAYNNSALPEQETFPPSRDYDLIGKGVSNYSDPICEVVIDSSTQLRHLYGLRLMDAKVIHDDKKGKTLRLNYITQDIIELCPARNLLVAMVETFLKNLQAKGLDWTAEQFYITVDLESFYGEFVDPFYVGFISLKGGISHFYAFDIKDPALDFWHSRTEPYYKTRQYVELYRRAEEKWQKGLPIEEENALKEELFFVPEKRYPLFPRNNLPPM